MLFLMCLVVLTLIRCHVALLLTIGLLCNGLLQSLKFQVIEIRDRIGLRPQSDATVFERLIAQIKDWLVIIENLDAAAFIDHAQPMPLSDVNDLVIILQHLSHAVDDMVDANILLERIRAGEIVVTVILRPPDQASAHVGFTRDGKKRHRQIQVRRVRILDEDKIVIVLGAFLPKLREYVGWTQSFRSRDHFPVACRTAIEERSHHEFRWQLSLRIAIKIPHTNGLWSRRSGLRRHREPENNLTQHEKQKHYDSFLLCFMASSP